ATADTASNSAKATLNPRNNFIIGPPQNCILVFRITSENLEYCKAIPKKRQEKYKTKKSRGPSAKPPALRTDRGTLRITAR
ncbi:MAG: hypothetical protein LBG07_09315, partial [Treponema sp.]|nr:hypothetical protein [Treponema sp.]